MENNFSIQPQNVNDFNLHFMMVAAEGFKPPKKIKYSSLKNDLKTGDIILVDGKYSYSIVMDIMQGNRWGHAAMVVRALDIDPENQLKLPDPLLWESNAYIEESTKNLWGTNRKIKEGPMLISLEERLNHTQCTFDGVLIAYRALDVDRSSLNYKDLTAYFTKVIHSKFPENNSDIILSVLLSRFDSCENGLTAGNVTVELDRVSGDFIVKQLSDGDKRFDNSLEITSLHRSGYNRMFCTELLAGTYIELGLLGDCPVSAAYIPKDFSDAGELEFLVRASLKREIFIDILS